jgi:hypothetical protein
MGSELRKYPRVSGYAKALLLGPMAPGYIRDLSHSGCQIAFMQPVPVTAGELITVRVIAEHDASMPAFEISLRVRWVKPDSIWFAIGGEVESKQGLESETVYEKLVNYYAGSPGST